MALQIPTNIDPGLLDDFAIEFNEAYELCESKLVELETNPTDIDLVNQLFRSVHTVKGNLNFIAFTAPIPLLQSVEDVLSGIRNGDFPFTSSLSDLVLLSLDRTKAMVDEVGGKVDSGLSIEKVHLISTLISKVATASDRERETFIHTAILELDPDTMALDAGVISPTPPVEVEEPEAPKQIDTHSHLALADERILKLLNTYSVAIDEDILFFLSLMKPMEARSFYWSGRCMRLLLLALGINRAAGNPINVSQLTAAVIMHDISMAFLPLDVLHKAGQLSEAERNTIQQHVHSSYELLVTMQKWGEAAKMVLQHHERPDGKGYPAGLIESEICDGAKLLAIIDSFDAITHSRAYTTKVKRPFIRAVLEVNSHAGSQFSAKWVEIFNPVVKKLNNLHLV